MRISALPRRPRCLLYAFLLAAVLTWSLAACVAAQDVHAALSQVEEAFRRGNERSLLEVAADRVEVAALEPPSLYSRAQAMYVMEDFFRTHPPKQFNLQQAVPSDGSLYAPGLYWSTSRSEPFQVYVRLRRMAQQWELREIRIEQRTR